MLRMLCCSFSMLLGRGLSTGVTLLVQLMMPTITAQWCCQLQADPSDHSQRKDKTPVPPAWRVDFLHFKNPHFVSVY